MSPKARWVFALFLTAAALMLAFSQHAFGDVDFDSAVLKTYGIVMRCVIWLTPGLFITAALLGWARRPKLALAYFICTLIYFGSEIIQFGWPTTTLFHSIPEYVIMHLSTITSPWRTTTLALLYLVRFRGKLEGIRIATIALSLIELIAGIVAIHLGNTIVVAFHTLLIVALLILSLFCAWCIAFRRKRDRATLENARLTTLYCPSCDAILTVLNPRECQCPQCQLRLTLSFEESLCKKCHYPLRGLMGDKCPECGEPLVHSNTPSPVHT